MFRRSPIIAVTLVVACGGSDPGIPPLATSASPQISAPGENSSTTGNYTFSMSQIDRRLQRKMPGDLEGTARAVLSAYAAIGIPATTLQRAPRVIGTERFVMPRSFAGKPNATYLNCGSTLAGVLANVYRIQAAVLVSVSPSGTDSTVVVVRLTALAFSNEGASGGGVDCGSTGALEQRLLSETAVAASIQRK